MDFRFLPSDLASRQSLEKPSSLYSRSYEWSRKDENLMWAIEKLGAPKQEYADLDAHYYFESHSSFISPTMHGLTCSSQLLLF